MQETTSTGSAPSRVLRSARVLKSYFEHKLNLSLELLTEAPLLPLHHGMQFSLSLGHCGVWGLKASGPLAEKTQAEISSHFHGLLGAMDELERRQNELERLELNYRTALENLPSNVILLRKPRKLCALPPRRRWKMRLDCMIECKDAADLHKIALELYAQSQSLAFLNYRDLPADCRLAPSELEALGAVTLLVHDILVLTRDEQRALYQLTQVNSVERPWLIVGANLPFSGLPSEGAVDSDLLMALSRTYLKLTRPFAEYKRENLIHYFLDSLGQNPS